MGKKSRLKKSRRNKIKSHQPIIQQKDNFFSLKVLMKFIGSRTIIFVFLSVLFFVAFYYLKKNTPSVFGGEISNFGDVFFSYNTHQNEGISPLCGCATEQESNLWRGITFVARHISLYNRPKDSPLTGYYITSPFPQEVSWTSALKFDATLYVISMPWGKEFDPSLLINNRLQRSYIRQSVQLKSEKALYYFTEGNLNVSLLGQYPIGSWIPGKNSSVSIRHERGMFPNALLISTIEEDYVEQKENIERKDGKTYIKEYNDYPLGDFIGSPIVLWSEDKSYVMKTKPTSASPHQISNLDHSIFYNKSQKIITAVLINPPFSIRVACMSFGSRHGDHDAFGRPSHINDAFNDNVIPRFTYSGKLLLSIIDPVEQSSEFDQIYQQMRENDIIVASDVGFSGRLDEEVDPVFSMMMFRLPPIPPKKGFNIFGQVASFKLTSAQGKIMIGSYSQDIMAPSAVEFNNIKTMTTEDKVISVPLQIDTTSASAKLRFQGVSDISINGESFNANINKYRFVINYLMLFFSFVSALGSILSLTIWQNRKK